MAMNDRASLQSLGQSKLFGRIEIAYWLGGQKHPLTGQHAVDILTKALVDVIAGMEPIRPGEPRPVIDRCDRIYRRLHQSAEREFQERWHYHRFER